MSVTAPALEGLVPPADPRLDGYALMEREMRRAMQTSNVVDHFYSVGSRVVRLRFAGSELVNMLTRAIGHLTHDPVGDPDLVVNIWDSESTGVPLSPLLRSLVDAMDGNPFAVLTPRHEISSLSNERVAATFELGSGVLTLFDRQRNEAIYWVKDPQNLPYYEKGAPFRTTFNWWLSEHGMQCVHAAAVGTERGAILLTGKGGSGKSTTALACVNTSLKYMSDDYCVFSTGEEEPHVYSLYNTGKLRDEADLRRQPHFAPWVVNPDRERDHKILIYIAEHAPECILRRAPVRAIVVPHVTGETGSRLTRVSPALALRALAPTSLFQLPGAANSAFFQMASLARNVPCYGLACGSDLAATTHLLDALLADLTAA